MFVPILMPLRRNLVNRDSQARRVSMKREPQWAGSNPGNHLAITVTSNGSITKGERNSLLQVSRLRARVAKYQVNSSLRRRQPAQVNSAKCSPLLHRIFGQRTGGMAGFRFGWPARQKAAGKPKEHHFRNAPTKAPARAQAPGREALMTPETQLAFKNQPRDITGTTDRNMQRPPVSPPSAKSAP